MATYNYTPTDFIQLWNRPPDPVLRDSSVPSGQHIFALEEETFTAGAGGDEVEVAIALSSDWAYRIRYGQVTIGNTVAQQLDNSQDPYEQFRWAPPNMPPSFGASMLFDMQMFERVSATYSGNGGSPTYGKRKALNIGAGVAPFMMTYDTGVPPVVLQGGATINIEWESEATTGTGMIHILYIFDIFNLDQARNFPVNSLK